MPHGVSATCMSSPLDRLWICTLTFVLIIQYPRVPIPQAVAMLYMCTWLLLQAVLFFPSLHFCLSKLCVMMAQTHICIAHTHFKSCLACFGLVPFTNQNEPKCVHITWVQNVWGHEPSSLNGSGQGQALLLHWL
jgi:hypothetical protein